VAISLATATATPFALSRTVGATSAGISLAAATASAFAMGISLASQNKPIGLVGKKKFPLRGMISFPIRDSTGDPRVYFRHKTSATTMILNSVAKLNTQNGEHHCKLFVPSRNGYVMGFKAYMPSDGVKRSIGAFLDGGEYQVELTYDADDKVSVYRGPAQSGGTLLGTTASAISALTTERRIEVEAVIHPSNGSVKVQVDGSNVLTLTGVNTRHTDDNRINGFAIGGGTYVGTTTLNLELRDFYWANSGKGFLENWSFAFVTPTGDGSLIEWQDETDNYLRLDEATTMDDDTTRIQSGGLDQPLTDLYTGADLSSGDNIVAVQVMPFCRTNLGSGYPWAMYTAVKSGGTTVYSDRYSLPQHPTSGNNGFYAFLGEGSNIVIATPQGGKWNEDNFNTAEFGFRVTNG
jgi:hypothetical protein